MNGNIGNMGDMGSMIAKMLEDPEALGKVMSIAGTLSSSGILNGLSLGAVSGDKEVSDDAESAQSNTHQALPSYEEKQAPCLNNERSDRDHIDDKGIKNHTHTARRVKACDRIRLLEAMRPFLSDEKRDKLDVVIKIIGLADAAGGLYKGK